MGMEGNTCRTPPRITKPAPPPPNEPAEKAQVSLTWADATEATARARATDRTEARCRVEGEGMGTQAGETMKENNRVAQPQRR